MRWFKRRKQDEIEKSPEEPKEEDLTPDIKTPLPPEKSTLPESTLVSLTDPVNAFIQRLGDLLATPDISAKTKALNDTRLQLIVGGEPVLLKKEGVQPMGLSLERSVQSDVFIRISDEAAGVLAMTSTLADFKKVYKKIVGATGVASFVTIKFHTPLDVLRAKGYFSVELLRILIDA